MKSLKGIILLSMIAITNVSLADYGVKVPLENHSGGNLPDGSIKLGNTNTPTNPTNPSTPESWTTIAPLYSSWINSGSLYDCSNWSPNQNTIGKGVEFTQTATDCKQDQTRARQEREQEASTEEIRNVGSPVIENNTLNSQSSTRLAIGTLENWLAIAPVYGSLVNSGGLYDCSNWSPATSTVTSGQSFTQTATDCKQDQTRTVQNREQETNTLEIRNVGSQTNELSTLTLQSNTRNATGTKIAQVCQPFSASNQWTVDLFVTYITWGGVNIGYPDPSATTYNAGGYKYTRNTYVTSSNQDMGTIYYYTVCREPI